jgi:hypothetical protein
MNEPHETNFHKTHHNLNLGGITILLLITYFMINDKNSIKMAKNLGISKWESPKFLILPIYESYNFMGLYIFRKNYI